MNRPLARQKLGGSCYIAQGEHALGNRSEDVISTILGSCVATCLWDPVAGIGGMNHILLPDSGGENIAASSYGANAMELLINAMISAGAVKKRFRAKLFGGATMYVGLSDAGKKNGDFVLDYLARESIPLDGKSLGGTQARRVEFWPADGRARQKLVEDQSVADEKPTRVITPPPGNDLELF
jgi:chemotaxis protein CheD